MDDRTPEATHNLRLRNLTLADYAQLTTLMDRVYPDLDGAWPRSVIASLVSRFPETQFCIDDNETVVAAALTARADYRRFIDAHTYDELVEGEPEVIHQPDGDPLYGLNVIVGGRFAAPRLRDGRAARGS